MDATSTLLKLTWPQVCENLPVFTNRFYDKLFSTNPSLRELFRGIDASVQDKHLRTMLDAITNGRLNTPRVINLGRRYARLGIRSTHYGAIVQTLLWALEQQLGASWTLAVQNAWDDTLTRTAAAIVASDRRLRHYEMSGVNLIPFPSTRMRGVTTT
jgi:hemoglobin-like flavoprotein